MMSGEIPSELGNLALLQNLDLRKYLDTASLCLCRIDLCHDKLYNHDVVVFRCCPMIVCYLLFCKRWLFGCRSWSWNYSIRAGTANKLEICCLW